MPIHEVLKKDKKKILLLGSGALSIGQAGEFDYSGTQGLKAIQEENIEVIVVNPNIATVQTNPRPNTKVYLYPVTPAWVTEVIKEERPDAIVAGFGGQTALNCVVELDRLGVLKQYNVTNLGTSVETLKLTEDRDLFAQVMREIGIPTPPSFAETTVEGTLIAAKKIGYPVILRAAFALGGLGSGFAHDEKQLKELAEKAFVNSPQVLIEKSLQGFKEIEYEVMRDSFGNVITICNMENFDPLGVHTGDSIVIVPSQTLSNDEYQMLRDASIRIVNRLQVVGECNVQLTLDPHSMQFYVIEVNARLSRSSALASKASGYPIAYIAAKVVLGFSLLELKNPVTTTTSAFFEPSLDYVILKIPKWDLSKFPGVSSKLGTAMKSIGEIMSIGRTFPEALQKAVRMISESGVGLKKAFEDLSSDQLVELIKTPNDKRMLMVVEAFRREVQVEKIYNETQIDRWFLSEIDELCQVEKEIVSKAQATLKSFPELTQIEAYLEKFSMSLTKKDWKKFKRYGFSDEQMALIALREKKVSSDFLTNFELQKSSLILRKYRLSLGVRPSIKKIDTTSAEYPTPSNYLYMSYEGEACDVEAFEEKSIIVIGSGSYRIGSSVEFDWCAVTCSDVIRQNGYKSILINCNPETVSTDYNSSDRLYFEELSLERILDIVDYESPEGVVVSMGGQVPNNLAFGLALSQVKILGHSAESIHNAENRNVFSNIINNEGIDQPRFKTAFGLKEIDEFINEVGFPILVRPSYVLSGTAMKVASSREELSEDVKNAYAISDGQAILLTEYLEDAREVELDGVAQKGKVIVSVVSEHLENAGIHSGDATHLLPPQSLNSDTIAKIKIAGEKIIKGLHLNGPFNIQFLLKNDQIKVIECNSRASRSFPFVTKVTGINLAKISTEVFLGKKLSPIRFEEKSLNVYGVKAPMFSFKRLEGADPTLGVEMASTGEVGCIARNFNDAFMLSLEATGIHKPVKGILISSGREIDKKKIISIIPILKRWNIPLYATGGTAKHLNEHGLEVKAVPWPNQNEWSVIDLIREKKVDMVINIPKNYRREELTHGTSIRKEAIRNSCSLLTNMEVVTNYFSCQEKSFKDHQLIWI